MIYLLIGVLIGIIVLQFGFIIAMHSKFGGMISDRMVREFESEQQWRLERQQLLDRIQAPSFDHLKHHEVKVIKAQHGTKEPEPLEPL